MLQIVGSLKKCTTFATANENRAFVKTMVPWMSGLVSGLQNRVRRFESARNLKETSEPPLLIVVSKVFLFLKGRK